MRVVRTPCSTTLICHAPLPWHAWSPSAFASRYASNPGTSPQFLLLAAGIPQRASRRTPCRPLSRHTALQGGGSTCLGLSRHPPHPLGCVHLPLRPFTLSW